MRSSPLNRLCTAIGELPIPQREVLLPLLALGIIERAPEGAAVPDWLARVVEAFLQSLGPDQGTWNETIDERLRAVGVSGAILRSLAQRAGTPADALSLPRFDPVLAARFEPRAEPAPGQTRAGPGARFRLQADPSVARVKEEE